jgi:predicted ABC-type ATPase
LSKDLQELPVNMRNANRESGAAPEMPRPPIVTVIAGANGAGKSTLAPHLLRDGLGIGHFVNADEIARGLSAFAPESVAFEAGRVMLARLDNLAANREDFSFESTLSSRSFAPRLRALKASGYVVQLFYVYIDSADLAVARVQSRVKAGGHGVPEPTIRRRYARSVSNMLELYLPLADYWEVLHNAEGGFKTIALGFEGEQPTIVDRMLWQDLANSVRNS